MIALMIDRPIRNIAHRYRQHTVRQEIPSVIQPKVRITQQKGKFLIKTVDSLCELTEALMLRYDVFHREYQKKRFPFGIDLDAFDADCDHLVIKSLETGRIIGTYRLLSSLSQTNFYSEQEFKLDEFLAVPGIKLELGRACIHKDFRNGVVISLLWRGINEYCQKIGAKYLFGCGSIKTTSPSTAAKAYQILSQNGAISGEYNIRPTIAYSMPGFIEALASAQNMASEAGASKNNELIPALLTSYLKAGAKIYGPPAYDEEFHCIDFLTILKFGELAAKYERKFSA